MNAKALLRGISWNHSRAFPPLVATAQRYEELHPDVEIRWEKRTLHDFGHADLDSLAESYDLLVVDHPMMGMAREKQSLLELGRRLDPSFLEVLASDSVGRSYQSYCYEGSLFALPLDAAAPAASYRPDLLQRAHADVPAAWADILKLARKHLIVMPGFHADVFLNFMALGVSRGAEIARNPEELLAGETARQCLDELRELALTMPAEIYEWNPIAVYEHLAGSDEHAYCPFAYSYSNYSRAGFAKHLIVFANPVPLSGRQQLRTVLGGTGLAVSARCRAPDVALEYLQCAAGADWQRTIYGLGGGQPARRSAWRDEILNRVANSFFERTLESVENAYVRPRYPGYIELQAQAGMPIVEYLRGGGSPGDVIEKVNALYRGSRAKSGSRHSHDS